MRPRIGGFDWDDGNRLKCQKHGVTPEEIEAAFEGELYVAPDPKHSGSEQRSIAVGRTKAGRHLFVAFALRQRGNEIFARPISARYMHKKEIEAYEKKSS